MDVICKWKLNKPFLPQTACGHGIYYSNKKQTRGRLTWHIHFSWPLRFLKRVFYVTHILAMNPLCSPDWPQIQHIPASLYLQNSRITSTHHLAQPHHEHSSHVKSNLASISTSTNSFGRVPTRDLVTEHAECLSFHPLQYFLKEAHHPLSRLLQEPSEGSRFPF